MIHIKSLLFVSDNSGAKMASCIKILKPINAKYANIGDIVKVSIKKNSLSKIKKGSIYNALIIRTKSGIFRKNGFFLKFNKNCIILLNEKNECIGTRIFGHVPYEVCLKNIKIINFISDFI